MMKFQDRVWDWCRECFTTADALTPEQRAFRFFEEAVELVQAVGTSQEDAEKLVRHVYQRPVGETRQEIGGVMVTLAALSEASGYDMADAGDREITRCELKTDTIREKDRNKPKRSPLAVGEV